MKRFLLPLGLFLVLAFFLEYLDTSVKTLDDVERYLGVPVLAVIPPCATSNRGGQDEFTPMESGIP